MGRRPLLQSRRKDFRAALSEFNAAAAHVQVTFKCNPEKFVELVEQEGIVPARDVGRYKWVSLERLDVLPWIETKDLIDQSYQMVAAKATAGPSLAAPRRVDS